MTGKQIKPDWIPWEPARWVAGTAEMDQQTEFVFFRLCMFAYVKADPIVSGSEKRNSMRCKVSVEEYRDALAVLVELEKVTITKNGVLVHSTEGRLRDSVTRISARQRGAAISRRRRELKFAGKKTSEINLIISKEFSDDQRSIQTDNTDRQTIQDTQGGVGEQFELVPSEGNKVDDAKAAVDLWNDLAKTEGLARVQILSDSRRKKLKDRLKQVGGIDGWNGALMNVADSDFLSGRVPNKDWKATFDFMLQEKSLVKIMERSYPPYRSEGRKASEVMSAIRDI